MWRSGAYENDPPSIPGLTLLYVKAGILHNVMFCHLGNALASESGSWYACDNDVTAVPGSASAPGRRAHMVAFTEPHFEPDFQTWLEDLGFVENPFAQQGWDGAALRELVAHRLAYCSRGQITRFEALCTSEIQAAALSHLIAAAQGAPYALLALCDALLRHVAAQGRTAITAADIAHVLAHFQQPPPAADVIPTVTGSSARPPSACAGLFVDAASGHVWVDGQQLCPPLTEQEFTLLRILDAQAPEIVPCEVLIREIWPEERGVVGDEQNLRKLISRLRRRLEPQGAGNDWRFIHSARGRGYWLHRDAAAAPA